jgi:hypothetical protein
VGRRQAHRHVEVVAPAASAPSKIGMTKRGSTALSMGDAVRLDEPATASAREASTWAASTRGRRPRRRAPAGARVVVGDDELLEEVAADGDADGGRADATGADDEDTHEIPCR